MSFLTPLWHSSLFMFTHFLRAKLGLNSRLDIFSPEAQKEVIQEYREFIGLGEKAEFGGDAFNTYSTNKKSDYTVFSETKGPDNTNIFPALKKPAAKPLRDQIKQCLAPQKALTDAKTEYNESVLQFKKLVAKVPDPYRAQDLIGRMAELKDSARKKIVEQHNRETAELTQLFTQTEGFVKPLVKALNLTEGEPKEVDIVKENMLKDLKAAQTKQLDEFTKSTTAAVETLHKAAEVQARESIFINIIRKNNEQMQKEIDRIINEKTAAKPKNPAIPEPKGKATVGISEDKMTLSTISLDDIPTIYSITGKEITKKNKGVYEIKMDSLLMGWRYWNDPRQNPKADFQVMAQAIRASGFDRIVFDIKFQDQELAEERAREAYEGAILSGFPADKIKILINSGEKEIKASTLFKMHQASFEKLTEKSKTVIDGLAKLTYKTEKSSSQSIKKKMDDLKKEHPLSTDDPNAPDAADAPDDDPDMQNIAPPDAPNLQH